MAKRSVNKPGKRPAKQRMRTHVHNPSQNPLQNPSQSPAQDSASPTKDPRVAAHRHGAARLAVRSPSTAKSPSKKAHPEKAHLKAVPSRADPPGTDLPTLRAADAPETGDLLRALAFHKTEGRRDARASTSLLMPLEQRVMLDGAAMTTALEAKGADALADSLEGDAARMALAPTTQSDNDGTTLATILTQTMSTREVVIISGRLPNAPAIVKALGPDVEALVLDPDQDGVRQIADFLKNQNDIDVLHVLSHGAPGSIILGDTTLSLATLADHTATLRTIGEALSATGDIRFYGCDVGQDRDFLQQLAAMTGADIAASSDLTGDPALGGDWDLEVQVGKVDQSEVAEELEHLTDIGVLAAKTVDTRVDAQKSFRDGGSAPVDQSVLNGLSPGTQYKVLLSGDAVNNDRIIKNDKLGLFGSLSDPFLATPLLHTGLWISAFTSGGQKILDTGGTLAELASALSDAAFTARPTDPVTIAPGYSQKLLITLMDQAGNKITDVEQTFKTANAAPTLNVSRLKSNHNVTPGLDQPVDLTITSVTISDSNDRFNSGTYTTRVEMKGAGSLLSQTGTPDSLGWTFTGNRADISKFIKELKYKPPAYAQAGDTTTVTITVTDAGDISGDTIGAGKLTSNSEVITFTMGNAAPKVKDPADRVIAPGTAATALGVITLSDPNSSGKGDGGYEVTVALSGVGSLGIAPSSGFRIYGFSGTTGLVNDLRMTGTLAQLEADLAKVTYTPGNVQAGKTGTITVTLKDPSGSTNDKSFTYTVSNAAPILAVPGDTTTVNPGDKQRLGGIGAFTVSDTNDPGSANGYTASLVTSGGILSQKTITATTLADLKTQLENITYTAPGQAAGTPHTVTITVTDPDGGSSTPGLMRIIIGNSAPMLAVPTQDLVISPKSRDLVLGAGKRSFALSDPNSPRKGDRGYEVTVALSGVGSLAGAGSGFRAVAGIDNTLSMTGTLAQLETDLTKVTYTPKKTQAGDTETITVTLIDPGIGIPGSKQQVVESFNFTIANAAPEVQKPADRVIAPGTTGTALGAITLSDPNSSGKGDRGYEVTVALSGVGSLAGVGSGFRAVAGATNTLSMTGTLAQLEADLAKVTYTPGNVQAGKTGTITVTLKDPSGSTYDEHFTYTISNAAPKVTSVPKDQTVIPGSGTPTRLDAGGGNFDLSDDNDLNGTDKGYTAVVEVPAKGGTLTYGGQTASRVTVGDATTTLAGLQALLDAVTYTAPGPTAGTPHTVTITVTDPDGAPSAPQDITFRISNVPPTLAVPAPQTVLPGSSATALTGLTIADLNEIPSQRGYTASLALAPGGIGGTLSTRNVLQNPSGDPLTLAELRQELAKVTYTPPAIGAVNAQDQIEITITDPDGASDKETLTFTMGDAPVMIKAKPGVTLTPGTDFRHVLAPSSQFNLSNLVTIVDANIPVNLVDNSSPYWTDKSYKIKVEIDTATTGRMVVFGQTLNNANPSREWTVLLTLRDLNNKILSSSPYTAPEYGKSGQGDKITLTITDSNGNQAVQKFIFDLANRPPTIDVPTLLKAPLSKPGEMGMKVKNGGPVVSLGSGINLFNAKDPNDFFKEATGYKTTLKFTGAGRLTDPGARLVQARTPAGGVIPGTFEVSGPLKLTDIETVLNRLQYTPPAIGKAGDTDKLEITIEDSKGLSSKYDIIFEIENIPPDLTIANTNIDVVPGKLAHLGTLVDPTNGFEISDANDPISTPGHVPDTGYKASLRFIGRTAGGSLSTLSLTKDAAGNDFTLATLKAALDAVEYTAPKAAPNTTEKIRVTIADPNGETFSKDINLKVINAAPALAVPAGQTVIPGSTSGVALDAGGGNFDLSDDNDSRKTGRGYTAKIEVVGDGTLTYTDPRGAKQSGSLINIRDRSNRPADIETELAKITYTPPSTGAIGDTVTVEITITDPNGGTGKQSLTFTMGNAAPEVTKPADRVVVPGTAATALGAMILSD
ncbi:MAG: DUF4347 domain-containing protein, partial [Pseudomonadota bacterium]